MIFFVIVNDFLIFSCIWGAAELYFRHFGRNGYSMEAATVIGLMASTCVIVSMAPQIVKVFKLKRADEISLGWLLIGILGTSLWLTYGILKNDIVIYGANALVDINFFALLLLKFKYGGNK